MRTHPAPVSRERNSREVPPRKEILLKMAQLSHFRQDNPPVVHVMHDGGIRLAFHTRFPRI
jgi:hypothetical protein